MQPEAADRMVRECVICPTSRRPRRTAPSWSRVATAVAAAVGADPAAVRVALDKALADEKRGDLNGH